MAKDKNLSRSAGIMSFASAISRATGLLNILVIAYAFGALDYLQDSYNLANLMPNMLFELIAGGILTSLLIPILVERILEDETGSWRLANNILNITLAFLVSIALLGSVFSYYFVRAQTFLVPTDSVSIDDVNFFFKIFIWEIVFYGMTAIFNGMLQAHRRFAIPAFAPIFNNLVVIGVVLFVYLPLKTTNPKAALLSLAIGTTGGIMAMALVQIPALWRLGWRWKPIIDLRDPAMRRLGLLAIPVIGYVLTNQIGMTVSNALAWQFEGGITAFVYSWRFFQMPYGLLAVSVSTVLFPRLAEHSALKDMTSFKKTLGTAVSATAFIMIPASLYFYIVSEPLIGIFQAFFGARGVSQISAVMAFFMIGLLPFSVFMLLNRVFYALTDSRTPLIVNAMGVPLNVLLNFTLVGAIGIAGLSMAHSLTYTFTMTLMFFALRRKIGLLNGRYTLQKVAKLALISAPVGAIMFLLTSWIPGLGLPVLVGRVVTVAVTAMAGGVAYVGICRLAGVEEVGYLSLMVKGVFGRHRLPDPEEATEQLVETER